MRESGERPERSDDPAGIDLDARIRNAGPGLNVLLAQARNTWQTRARDGQPGAVGAAGAPGWRPFEDAFPTFYQFTNKPR